MHWVGHWSKKQLNAPQAPPAKPQRCALAPRARRLDEKSQGCKMPPRHTPLYEGRRCVIPPAAMHWCAKYPRARWDQARTAAHTHRRGTGGASTRPPAHTRIGESAPCNNCQQQTTAAPLPSKCGTQRECSLQQRKQHKVQHACISTIGGPAHESVWRRYTRAHAPQAGAVLNAPAVSRAECACGHSRGT